MSTCTAAGRAVEEAERREIEAQRADYRARLEEAPALDLLAALVDAVGAYRAAPDWPAAKVADVELAAAMLRAREALARSRDGEGRYEALLWPGSDVDRRPDHWAVLDRRLRLLVLLAPAEDVARAAAGRLNEGEAPDDVIVELGEDEDPTTAEWDAYLTETLGAGR